MAWFSQNLFWLTSISFVASPIQTVVDADLVVSAPAGEGVLVYEWHHV